MWILFDAAVFIAGYAASIYSWPRIKVVNNGAQAEIATLEARLPRSRRLSDHVVRGQACCLHSLTMAWSYCLAFAGGMQGLDSVPMLWAIRP